VHLSIVVQGQGLVVAMDTEFVGTDGDGDECSSSCISLLWSRDKEL